MNTSKIIRGIVNGRNYTVTSPIVKEDYGLVLQIEGVELPPTYQVDFSNSEQNGTSVTMIGNSDGVLIPRQFIDSGKDVFAFLYHVGADYGRTVYKFRIPNKLRPDRTDEEPTPEEQSVIDQTIAALNDAVESTQEAQQAIEDMSVSATTLAEGESATVTKSEQDGVVHLDFGIPKGQTGDTPNITASKTGKTTSIYVDGSEVAQIEDGTDGVNGDDGYSPTASVTKSGKTATITITDKNGTTTAQVEDGTDGTDGVSPTVSITPITGGHRITITDADGEHSADVMDGDDYTLTAQDKQDIAALVDAGGMVVNATLVSGTRYTIDSTYDDIKSALSQGKTVVVMTNGVPQPYVGNAQLDNQWFLAFGVSTIYNNVATLTGFMIPEAYQNIAVWTEQNTTIPQLNDVQINGSSIVEDGVANVPMAKTGTLGTVAINSSLGISIGNTGNLFVNYAGSSAVKSGANTYYPLTPKYQHEAVFFGLAKAAGDITQASSDNPVGTYTEKAKAAIRAMLGIT